MLVANSEGGDGRDAWVSKHSPRLSCGWPGYRPQRKSTSDSGGAPCTRENVEDGTLTTTTTAIATTTIVASNIPPPE